MGNQRSRQPKPAQDIGNIVKKRDDFNLLHGLFNQEQLDELDRAFQTSGLDGGLKCLKRQANYWENVPVNIAVIGISGVGKSTFINAVRGMTCEDEGYAKVGTIETTEKVHHYVHPTNKLIKFWDVPGVGTPNFPKTTYLQKIGIDNFDVYMIMASARFLVDDAWLCQEIKLRKKNLYFVRTKVAFDVNNDKRDNALTHNPKVVLDKIKSDIMTNLAKIKVSAPVFLIDSCEMSKYEFDELNLAIINDLPAHQRHAMLLSMLVRSKNMVKTKVKQLHQDSWIKACTIACNIGPTPSILSVSTKLDSPAIQEVADGYMKQLDLDEGSLLRRASELNVEPKALADIVNRAFPDRRYIHDHIQPDSQSQAKDRTITGLQSFLLAIIHSRKSIEYIRRRLDDLLDKMQAVALEIADIMPRDMDSNHATSRSQITPHHLQSCPWDGLTCEAGRARSVNFENLVGRVGSGPDFGGSASAHFSNWVSFNE